MDEKPANGLTLGALQRQIRELYGDRDEARGDAATFLWLAEEFGELATALRSGTQEELAMEMADVLAWLATLANLRDVADESGTPTISRREVDIPPGETQAFATYTRPGSRNAEFTIRVLDVNGRTQARVEPSNPPSWVEPNHPLLVTMGNPRGVEEIP